MDEALELANKLGRAIARSDRFKDLREAEATAMGNEEAVQKLKERDEILKDLHKKEQAGEPIEVSEKHALAEVDEWVRSSMELAQLFKAQADFQELMNLVNEQIGASLTPKEAPGAPEAEADVEADAAESESPPAE